MLTRITCFAILAAMAVAAAFAALELQLYDLGGSGQVQYAAFAANRGNALPLGVHLRLLIRSRSDVLAA